MSDEPPDNVIKIGHGGVPRQGGVGYSFACKHAAWEVDKRARSVSCQTCKAELDPFQVLYEYALAERSYRYWSDDEERVRRRLNNMLADEKRAKARLRNVSRKDADVAVAAEREMWERRTRKAAYKAREIARTAAAIAKSMGVGGQPEDDREK